MHIGGRASLVVVAGGVIGAAFALAFDTVTSSISPEYFSIAKRLGDEPGLDARVRELAIQAGASAGVLGGCVLAWCGFATRARPSVPLRGALASMRLPLAGAVLGAVLAGVAGGSLPPTWVPAAFDIESAAARRLLVAWSAHGGAYAGGLVGLIVAGIGLRRGRAGGVEPASDRIGLRCDR